MLGREVPVAGNSRRQRRRCRCTGVRMDSRDETAIVRPCATGRAIRRQIAFPDQHPRRIERELQARVAVPERVRHATLFGRVDRRADDANECSGRVAYRRVDDEPRELAAIAPAEEKPHAPTASVSQRGEDRCCCFVAGAVGGRHLAD